MSRNHVLTDLGTRGKHSGDSSERRMVPVKNDLYPRQEHINIISYIVIVDTDLVRRMVTVAQQCIAPTLKSPHYGVTKGVMFVALL